MKYEGRIGDLDEKKLNKDEMKEEVLNEIKGKKGKGDKRDWKKGIKYEVMLCNEWVRLKYIKGRFKGKG